MSSPQSESQAQAQSHLRPPSPAHTFDSSSRTITPSFDLPRTSQQQDPPDLPAKERQLNVDGYEHNRGDIEQVFALGEQTPTETEREKEDPYLVGWDGTDDKANPMNWNRMYRWYITMLGALLTLNASFASSAPSGVLPQLIQAFSMSQEVATLLIALFVAGYCVGPLFWGPLSESLGRRPIFILSFSIYTLFQVACALAPNTGALLAFRFLGGAFAAAPLTNAGAILADIWDADTRGKASAFFTLAPFAGPALGPIVSGYMALAGVDWRWLFWVLAIFAGVCLVLIIFTLPETYAPVLLQHRARAIRLRTGNPAHYAPLDHASTSLTSRLSAILGRPFKILFLEPMLLAITIYMSFVYGCIYLLFEAFPIVFTEGHGFNSGVSGLMYLPLFLGGVVGVILYLTVFNPRYEKAIEKFKPQRVPPEYRLEMAIVGAPAFAIAFFWFGWTSYPSISFWSPAIATSFIGLGVVFIFLSLINYIIDAYLSVAASALASNTVVRSAFGAGFPLFATQMYVKLNPRWASTLLGCIALVMIPIPLLLRAVGPTLRKKSRYAPTKNI